MLEYKVLESAVRSTNIFCFSSFELNFPSEPEQERIKVFHLLSLSAVRWAALEPEKKSDLVLVQIIAVTFLCGFCCEKLDLSSKNGIH